MDPEVLVDLVRLASTRGQLWYLTRVLSHPPSCAILSAKLPHHEFLELQTAAHSFEAAQQQACCLLLVSFVSTVDPNQPIMSDGAAAPQE